MKMITKLLRDLNPKMLRNNGCSWLMDIGCCLLLFVSVTSTLVWDANLSANLSLVAAPLSAIPIVIFNLFSRPGAFGQGLAKTNVESSHTIWHAHQRDDASQKVIEQLMFERDAAKKCSETAQKVIEQLKFEREDARKQVEELRRLTKLQNFTIYSNSELHVATDNFHESFKLGEGGFGIVYKGILHNTTIAIKMLKEGSRQGEKEFYQEIEILSKVQHPNVVTLIGACLENRAVIYEYLPNGSLEDRLRCKNDSPPLSWLVRTHIAFEIGSALSFLHCSKTDGIAHGDLKPGNILLDLNNVSKISDFGLCRELHFTDTASVPFHSTDVPKGTNGYMDPEYYSSAMMTAQSDVYSFGIILLELVTCKDIYGIRDLVIAAQQNGTLKTLIDASAGPWPFKQAKKMISLGLRCSDPVRKNRPDLTEVLKEIKSMLQVDAASALSRAICLVRLLFCK